MFKICFVIFALANIVLSSEPVSNDCSSETLCDDSDESTGPVCALDKKDTCFVEFPSMCFLEIIACLYDKEYILYHMDYCSLEGFACKKYDWNALSNGLR